MTVTTLQTILPGNLARIAAELERDPRAKSPHTRRGYLADLAAFEVWRAGRSLTKLLVAEYAAELQRAAKAPASINRALAAVRWWARKLADLAWEDPGLTAAQRAEIESAANRAARVPNVRGTRAQRGRQLAAGELAALLRACRSDPGPAGVRDAAVIALAAATGMRRAELAGLQLADLQMAGKGEYDVVIAHGKGDKTRTLRVGGGAAAYVADWLHCRGTEPGPLFFRILCDGALVRSRALSASGLVVALEKRREAAEVKGLSFHDFRRTFVSDLLAAGADLSTVQRLCGHASPVTTAGYDRRDEETRRNALRLLFIPYLPVS